MNKILFLASTLIWISCSDKKQSNTTEPLAGAEEVLVSEVIAPEAFINKFNQTDGATLIDLRTPAELEEGIVEGAINIDFQDDMFKSRLLELDKDKPYFVYCARGGRSGKAASLMKELKFKEVYDMDGGFTAWTALGLPVSAKATD